MGNQLQRTVNDLKLSEIIDGLPIHEQDVKAGYPVIDSDKYVKDIYSALASHETIIVQDITNATQHVLSRQDILKYYRNVKEVIMNEYLHRYTHST